MQILLLLMACPWWMIRLMAARQNRVVEWILLSLCESAQKQNFSVFSWVLRQQSWKKMNAKLQQKLPVAWKSPEPLPFRPLTPAEMMRAFIERATLSCLWHSDVPKTRVPMHQHKGKIQAVMIDWVPFSPVFAGVYKRVLDSRSRGLVVLSAHSRAESTLSRYMKTIPSLF